LNEMPAMDLGVRQQPYCRELHMKLKIFASVAFFCWAAIPLQADVPQAIGKQYKEACDRLVCQCGCNEQLSVCAMQNCGSATPMRAEIQERLLKGESVDQIVESFVARVGKQVLSAPTTKGFDLAAWVAPFLILCVGLIVVGWVAVRLVRPVGVPVEGAQSVMDPRIEKELREFEEES
jgi:cytochrome c-type biogenesis protein CcmH/NrfF